MLKLLRADFHRLIKYKPFIILIAVIALFSAYLNYGHPVTVRESPDYYIFPFELLNYLSFVVTVFISLFSGINFSDGVIRNKLYAGHSKVSIYLSNAIVTAAISTIIGLVYMTSGLWLTAMHKISAEAFAAYMFSGAFSLLAFSATGTFVVFVCRGRTIPLVVGAVVIVGMFIGTARLNDIITQPEYIQEIESVDGVSINNVSVITTDADIKFKEVKNERYISDPKKRKALETAYYFLPTSRLETIAGATLDSETPDHLYYDSVSSDDIITVNGPGDIINKSDVIYCVAFWLLITTAGTLIFRKEDIQ